MESQTPLHSVPPEVKEFLEYPALMQQLIDRGMNVSDRKRCERKLAQVGYYRLQDTGTLQELTLIQNVKSATTTSFSQIRILNLSLNFICSIKRSAMSL